jgi:homoaconitase/3-isopropylmalate dehydratase large subunit
MTIVCEDSHTFTHGAFEIGTVDLENIHIEENSLQS